MVWSLSLATEKLLMHKARVILTIRGKKGAFAVIQHSEKYYSKTWQERSRRLLKGLVKGTMVALGR